eukprot:gene16373-19482_t
MSEPVENVVPAVEGGEEKKSKKQLNKEEAKRKKEEKKAEEKAKKAAANPQQQQQQQQGDVKEENERTDNYGKQAINTSASREGKKYTSVADISAALDQQTVLVRVRVQGSRAKSSKLCFMTLRDQLATIQAVCAFSAGNISASMVKFAANISKESIVDIEAKVMRTPSPIESCTQSDVELQVITIFTVSEAAQLPLILEDLARPSSVLEAQDAEIEALTAQLADTTLTEQARKDLETKKSQAGKYVEVSSDKRLDNRVIDLRVPAHQAIFRLQSAVGSLFREHLTSKGFLEIHTPKMISSASESGASVFKLGYFDTQAYLAQSPQFYKQMAICADLERVFEIGPVFRAENSFTHRHLTEFTGLDLEMTFREHYHEVLDELDATMCAIFKGLETRFKREIDIIASQYGFEPFCYTYPSPRFTFDEAAAMLTAVGEEVKDNDINTTQEKMLGKMIKKSHGVDFYIIDKFYRTARPFYTMPDPANPLLANAYDLFMRGEEICSGAQRIHDAKMLEDSARAHGINIESIQAYIDAFKYGAAPHAGGGVGLERVVMLYMGLSNIRKTSMFPRDPKRIAP